MALLDAGRPVERWGIHEFSLDGPRDGNPFTDVSFSAEYSIGHRSATVDGFYDGDGTYRVRFSPDTEGAWTVVTRSNVPALDGQVARFLCMSPSAANHGPVRVAHRYHFAYEDGTPFRQVGTTCYAWIHQGAALEERTLATLRQAPFNKLRMCVFPKHYRYNRNEPPLLPFERRPDGSFNWERFEPAFWRHLEGRVGDLLALGIEADVILFHPYDRWGFATLDAATDERYVRYVVARLAAYRNVWWSLANEFDLMTAKSMADWDRLFRLVQQRDPVGHLRSVHNCRAFYDHSRPWVTHASIQHWDLSRAGEWRAAYGKPIVDDECQYEGNIPNHWGNLPAWELVHRFWLATVGGIYAGHGECYLDPDEVLWWSKGGTLHGSSPSRLAFLRQVLEEGPEEGLEPQGRDVAGQVGRYYLYYSGVHQPAEWSFALPQGEHYRADLLDTWEMTISPLAADLAGEFTLALPGKPFQAVRLERI